jgi:hypothetical protein
MKKNIVFFLFATAIIIVNSCKKNDDEGVIGLTPEIVSVSPDKGTISTELTIEGNNFEQGAKVFVGGIESPVVTVSSKTIIYAHVPSGIEVNTALDVVVKNPGGGQLTFAAAFTAIPPVLKYVNSATKPSGIIGSTVILEGVAFGNLQGESKIYFSDGAGGQVEAVIASPDDWTNEFIVTTVPTGTADGPIYLETELGKSNEIEFILAQAATFSPSTISWIATTSLPLAVSGHNAVYLQIDDVSSGLTKSIVYVTGGEDNTPAKSNQAIYGEIGVDGSISSWTSTSLMTNGLAFHKVIAATPFNSKVKGTGYLFSMGGINESGTIEKSISVAKINNDGSLVNWTASNIQLPAPLHSFGAALFRGAIYIAGGATINNEPVNKVYRSEIDSMGALGEWEELASLANAVSYHGFLNFGAYLYVAGGESVATTPEANSATTNTGDIYYARLDIRTGGLTSEGWVLNDNTMQKSRSKHSTLAVGGNMFISSGVYSAANRGSSENSYAQIFSDGTVDTFGGATGSNTLLSQGGVNLFNQASISYTDADGVAHVMILGGDDVGTPGTKVSNVFIY